MQLREGQSSSASVSLFKAKAVAQSDLELVLPCPRASVSSSVKCGWTAIKGSPWMVNIGRSV